MMPYPVARMAGISAVPVRQTIYAPSSVMITPDNTIDIDSFPRRTTNISMMMEQLRQNMYDRIYDLRAELQTHATQTEQLADIERVTQETQTIIERQVADMGVMVQPNVMSEGVQANPMMAEMGVMAQPNVMSEGVQTQPEPRRESMAIQTEDYMRLFDNPLYEPEQQEPIRQRTEDVQMKVFDNPLYDEVQEPEQQEPRRRRVGHQKALPTKESIQALYNDFQNSINKKDKTKMSKKIKQMAIQLGVTNANTKRVDVVVRNVMALP